MPSPQQENQWPCMVTPPISYVSKSLTEVPNNTNGVVQQSHECRSYVCRAGGFLGTSLIRTDKFSVVYCESVNLIGYITVFYLNNRVFLSRNYRLIVAQRKFDVLKNKYLPQKRSFEGKYASFKNIKFPRGSYQTDNSETNTLVFIVHH